MKMIGSWIIAALLLGACCGFDARAWDTGVKGSGVMKEETRILSGFTGIRIENSADVTVKEGAEPKCTISTDDNLLPLILTEVESDTLRIDSKGSCSTSLGIKVVVEMPMLTSAEIHGSGSFIIREAVGETLTLRIDGSGDIVVAGEADELKARINGSGDIRAADFKVRKADVAINGSGDIHVYATGELSAEVRGSGDIFYKGTPESLHKAVFGSGDIVNR